jgi:chromosome segregation ATPase
MDVLFQLIEQIGIPAAIGVLLFWVLLESRRSQSRLNDAKESWQLEAGKQAQKRVDKLQDDLTAMMEEREADLKQVLQLERENTRLKLVERDTRIQQLESTLESQRLQNLAQVDHLQGQINEYRRRQPNYDQLAQKVLSLEEALKLHRDTIETLTRMLKQEQRQHQEVIQKHDAEMRGLREKYEREISDLKNTVGDVQTQAALAAQRADTAINDVQAVRQLQTKTLEKITDKLLVLDTPPPDTEALPHE